MKSVQALINAYLTQNRPQHTFILVIVRDGPNGHVHKEISESGIPLGEISLDLVPPYHLDSVSLDENGNYQFLVTKQLTPPLLLPI